MINLITDVLQTFALLALTYWIWRLHQRLNSAGELISEETRRKVAHANALERLTDPEAILEDMENGARLREMHDANRTTLPREDAKGPHAKVWRPQIRAKLPSRWNPPQRHNHED